MKIENEERYENGTIYNRQSPCGPAKLTNMVPARVVLYLLSFTGFLVSFMMRTDINIAIVAMVKPTSKSDTNESRPSHCYVTSNSTRPGDAKHEEQGELPWNSTTQSAIIGSFYWCYILSQVAGGILTQRFGTKNVFGVSQLITAICSLLMPTAANVHYGFMILLRSVQGVASGLTWPAMYALVGHWIPPSERSRFMSSFQGFTFGIGVTYPLGGFIIAHYGWSMVFYTTGSIGIVWCVFWFLLAFNTPASHPRISQQELNYIEANVRNQVFGAEQKIPVPWKSIFKSLPAWSIGITTFGRIWVHYVFITEGPKYMKAVLGFPIKDNGVLSGAPFICSYLTSVVFCYVADRIVTRNILSLINVRKIFTALSQIVPGVLLILIGYLDCNYVLVLVVWFVAVSLITAAYAGAMASIVDIAPNFAGPVLAFAQTIHMMASFLSPIMAGLIVRNPVELDEWRTVFALTAFVACTTYIVYQIFGTADIQAWNYPDQKYPDFSLEDSQPLNTSPQKNGKKNEP